MAPKEGEVAMPAGEQQCSSPDHGSGSSFWDRLNTLPVVQSTIQNTMNLYSTSKGTHALVGKGLGYLEYGVSVASTPVIKAASSIADKYPVATTVATTTAVRLDTLACQCLETIENKVPALHKPPGQVVSDVRKGASSAVHSGVRKVLKTYPGQQVVRGLDTMITWSVTTLDKYESTQDEQDKEQSDKPAKKNPEQEAEGMAKYIPLDPAKLYCTLANGLVVPVHAYLQVLKMVRHMLASASGVQLRQFTTSSPRKSSSSTRKSVLARRKVSPRKRLARKTLVSRVTGSAMDMLEWSKRLVVSGNAKELVSEGSASKRKLEEDSDDSWDSDREGLNLLTALDQYHSCEDSDYCPAEQPTEDSLEYNSGDHTESDLESEEAGVGKRGETLRQLKDQKAEGSPLISPQHEGH